jgi:aldehyde dehydrogenase (NAD+)
MMDFPELYVDGRWQRPSGAKKIEVLSASTEEVIGSVPEGVPEDVNAAVDAARRAFESGWAQTSREERAEWLEKLAAALKERSEQIARTIAMEVGSPISIATSIQAGLPVTVTSGYANILREARLEHEIGNSLVVREPVGVVGAITPWNYPLHQIMAKVAPALAAGCTVVLKPSEIAPLNAMILAEAAIAIGLPAGVLNIVTGFGPVVGEAIASHPHVDMVSFTGSVRAGKRVAALGAESIKKVTLELGGKSACVILDDAPIEKAVTSGTRNAMLNSGQTCSAWTRMLVPRNRQQDAIDLAAKAVGGLTIGDPLDPATRLGPLISATQRQRVEGYIAKGKQEGARVVAGGGRPAAFAKGYYVEATVFADVKSPMTIASRR